MHSYEEETRRMTPTQLAAATAVGVSALALVVKLLLARASGLVSVSAAAFHVLAGLLYALLILGILYTPEKAEVEEEPDLSEAEREYMQYQTGIQVNFRRYEAILALLGSAVLLTIAYFVFSSVLNAEPVEPQRVTVTLAGLAVVFFGMQFLGQFTWRIGMQDRAPGLVAASFHAKTDAFATLLAALAVITAAMGFGVERFFAGVIGLLLVADAAQLFVDATRRLVGLQEEGPTAQLPFWVRLRDALRAYAQLMPPFVRWLLRYEDAMTPAELRAARRWAIALVVALYLASGIKSIQPGQMGALKVFGNHQALLGPGLAYAPWPFASLRVAPVERIQRVRVGYDVARVWAAHDEQRPEADMLWSAASHESELFKIDAEAAKFMLGDTTQVEAHLALTYSIERDAAGRYLFAIEDPSELVQRATQHAFQELMLTRTLDEVLVEDRSKLEHLAAEIAQRILDPYKLGIQVHNCLIVSLHPPIEVLDAFVDVASAQEEAERERNVAESYAATAVKTGQGEAARRINVARGEKSRKLGEARGSTAEFRQVLQAASADPDAVRVRLRLETLERVLEGRRKVVLPRGQGGNRPEIWFGGGPTAEPGTTAPAAAPTPPGGAAGSPAEEAPAEGGDADAADANGS